MKKFYMLLLCTVVAVGMFSCRSKPGEGGGMKTGPARGENIFRDQTLQKIYTLQDRRDSRGLLGYFNDKNPRCREAAAAAFASVQDRAAVQPLAGLLADEDRGVRKAAAYALGQIKHRSAESFLVEAFGKEKSPPVKRHILEALGKCCTETGLAFITGMEFSKDRAQLLCGQAWGIYRAALQGIVSPGGTEKAWALTGPGMPERVRFIAGSYLSRARGIDLSGRHRQLIEAFKGEENIYTRMNLVLAMARAKHPEVLEFLESVLTSSVDYRLKVNAVRVLGEFDYEEARDSLSDALSDPNVHVAAAASEFFPAKGIAKEAQKYFDIARGLTDWRCRGNMLAAALKYAAHKKPISDFIIAAYRKSGNTYEKAILLRALSGDVSTFRFVESQVFSPQPPVIKSQGMEALVEMRRDRDFESPGKGGIHGGKEDPAVAFADIFKRAAGSGDTALVGLAAGILRDPKMNFKEIYRDHDFLKEALRRCRLPGDIEAYLELKKTIAFFEDKEESSPALPRVDNPIDWRLVTSIAPQQEIIVKTDRGDITVQLLVNESPGSVSNFIRLVKSGFYEQKVFHRVAPNFVVQGGCPRGDGWGGPDFSIRSELGPLYYEEGSVGMASAGKDTEGSQWFITHSAPAYLDGRYTIFGRVVSGMEVVHRIEVGDKILGFEFIP